MRNQVTDQVRNSIWERVSRRKSLIKIGLAVVAVAALTAYIYHTSVFRPAKNFHEIDPGKFYRSAQLSKDEFAETVKKYGIRTVVNLRGSQPGEWWFDDEKDVLGQMGVKLENIGFSTEQMQTKEDWARYAEILKTAERPILVHCRSGADRTSEASAVYVMGYMGKTKAEALDQLSIKYLHVSLFIPAKNVFIENYGGLDWLLTNYDPCQQPFRPYAKNESHCPPPDPGRVAGQ